MAIKDLLDSTVEKLFGATPADKIKLPDKQNNEYRNWLTNAKAFHKEKFYKEAKRYVDYYRSELSDNKVLKKDPNNPYDIFCNEFWVNAQTLLPNLFFQNPYVSVNATTKSFTKQIIDPYTGGIWEEEKVDNLKQAELLEAIINEYYEILGIKKEARLCVRDAILMHFAVMKLGWQTKLKGAETDNLELVNDNMTSERFNPLNFLVDPEGTRTDLRDAKYIVFKYIKATETIKKNPLYKGVTNLQGSKKLIFSGEDDDPSPEYHGDGVDISRNELYEIWDRVNKKIIVYVDTLDYPIRYDDWPYDSISGFPVEILCFNDDPEIFYGIPDFRAYESQVILKTKLRRKMVDLFMKLNRIFAYDVNAIDDKKVIQNLLDSPTGGIVGFKNPQGRDIRGFLVNMNDFVLNDSYFALENIINSDIERHSGISDFQRGLISEAKRTATEMLNISSIQNLRVEYKKDIIVEWLEKVTEKMIQLLKEKADQPQIQKLKRDNKIEWIEWNKEDIQGGYGVGIDVGTMVKQNVEMKSKQAMERFQTLVNEPLLDRVKLVKDTLKALGEKDPDSALNKLEVTMYEKPQAVQLLMQAGLMPGMEPGNAPAGNSPPSAIPQGVSGLGIGEARAGQMTPETMLAPQREVMQGV